MADKHFKENVLEQLRHGIAKFEIVSSPVTSIANLNSTKGSMVFHRHSRSLFFAKIAPSHMDSMNIRGHLGSSTKKVERYSVQKVTVDGRCLFRALVKGMTLNDGRGALKSVEEKDSADSLRKKVKAVICDSGDTRLQYKEALVVIEEVEESLKSYCQRINSPEHFWGGEAELLVLSKYFKQPIIVYKREHEHIGDGWRTNCIQIAEYGTEFNTNNNKVVRLLYSIDRNHYDLLI